MAVDEAGKLAIDNAAAKRAADIQSRGLDALSGVVEDYAQGEGVDEAFIEEALRLAVNVVQAHGLRSGEWGASKFSADGAASIVLERSRALLADATTPQRDLCGQFVKAFYHWVFNDQDAITALESEFRSTVLKSIEQLSSKSASRPLSQEASSLLAAALLGIPVLPWRPGISPPGALLRADIDVAVPFFGRRAELDELKAWREDARPIALRVLVGPGGMGKTRLLLEACRVAQSDGWQAGFLHHGARSAPPSTWQQLLKESSPALVVVDYAESRREEITHLLAMVLVRSARGPSSRVVLIARDVGDWWEALKTARDGVGDLVLGSATDSPIRLSALADSIEERQRAFEAACASFSARLARRGEPAPPDDLGSSHYARALLINMLALASVEGVKVKGDRGLLDYVLARERRFWNDMALQAGLSATMLPGIAKALTVVTLLGGISTAEEALAIFERIDLLKGQARTELLAISKLLHDAYPGDRWIEPLLPDLLGEHLAGAEADSGLLAIVFGGDAHAALPS